MAFVIFNFEHYQIGHAVAIGLVVAEPMDSVLGCHKIGRFVDDVRGREQSIGYLAILDQKVRQIEIK